MYDVYLYRMFTHMYIIGRFSKSPETSDLRKFTDKYDRHGTLMSVIRKNPSREGRVCQANFT